MKIFFAILLGFVISYAQLPEYLQTQEESVFQLPPQESSEIEEIPTLPITKSSNEEQILSNEEIETQVEKEQFARFFEEVPFYLEEGSSRNIYAKFIEFPKAIYTPQRFAVKIEAIITTTAFTKIETRFLNAQGISVINPEQEWTQKGKNSFESTYFFKTHAQELQIPTFQIVLYNNEEIIDAIFLQPKEVINTKIAIEDIQFSNIIASDLKVISAKTRQYNNDELLTILELEATNGNLEDFRLKEYNNQLLLSLEDEYPQQKLTYNTIIPIHKKELRFSYYNTTTNDFKLISVPLVLEEELVSTQTNLNPNESNLEIYKKIAFGAVTIFFLVIYILKRRNIYIIIALILATIFFMYVKPNGAMIIEENTNIYILPTNKSTVFFITPTKQIVEVLEKKSDFSKIIFKIDEEKTTVGWVKEKDIVED